MTTHDEQTKYPDNRQKGDLDTLAGRLAGIRQRLEAAARRAGRNPADVSVIAVSKTHPAALLNEALAAGQADFGENRIQEALGKMEEVAGGARWHLIGHLQRNKVQAVAGRFDLIHSVDSVRLIEELEKRCASAGITQRILLQVNVSGEASKFGVTPGELPDLLAALQSAPHLRGEGLMTIPPYELDPEQVRPHFRRLRELMQSVGGPPQFTPKHLSMGMSGDFEVAIEEGATQVRIGSAIFGVR